MMTDYLNVKYTPEQKRFIMDYKDVELTDEQQTQLQYLLKHHSDTEHAKKTITNAFKFAVKAHEGVKRKSGDDYVSHPIAVATQLCNMHADFETICAGLLHDTVEDVDVVTTEMLSHEFTPTIADLVDGVTKVSPKGATKEEAKISTVNKLILSIEKDPRIIIIKLVDRMHNMSTIYGHPKPSKRVELAQQTLDIFVPLARMFSMYAIKDYLEERCYEIIQNNGLSPQELAEAKAKEDYVPSEFDKLETERKEKYECNDEVMQFIAKSAKTSKNPFLFEMLKTDPKIKLSMSDPKVHVDFKFKIFSQISSKMKALGLESMEQIDDLMKFIVNLNSVDDCYRAVNAIESYQKEGESEPYFGKAFYFKDYIKKPAFNGYQSIHARYYAKEIKKNIQIEFRTFEMKSKAVDGIASCWDYDRKNPVNKMLEFLKGLPFYDDLIELCGEYNGSKYSSKNRQQIELRLFNGLKNKIFAKRIRIRLGDEEYQEHKDCTLAELLRKHHFEYRTDGSMFQINGAYVMQHQILKDGDVIFRIPPVKDKVRQRENIQSSE